MRKAVPVPSRPRSNPESQERDSWQKAIDSFDRSVRRSNFRFKTHCLRLDHALIGCIDSSRTLRYFKFTLTDTVESRTGKTKLCGSLKKEVDADVSSPESSG
ncbi:MAG TPA: hypothetical protein ENN67_01555 [Firmicutes bacterium]|nr:hypothetical protein [Bacillota bacterium]